MRLAGWLPAVILPTATFDQLWTVVRAGSGENVSILAWALFLLANVGAFGIGTHVDRVQLVQKILAFGLSAALDAVLVVVLLFYRFG